VSLYNTFNTGVSGLGAQSRRLGLISDNIANVNTTGFKAVRSNFSDIIAGEAQSFRNAPGTVSMIAKPDVNRQGQILKTGVPTDMAISGDGFFIVRDRPGVDSFGYTRSGSFVIDGQGNLRTREGAYVQGVAVVEGTETTAPSYGDLKNVRVPQSTLSAAPTTRVAVAANLPSSAGAIDPETSPYVASVDVYDSLGESHQLDFVWSTPDSGTGEWDVSVFERGVETALGTFDLNFDAEGRLIPQEAEAALPTIELPVGTGTDTRTIMLSFDGTTALSGRYSLSTLDQNGAPAGQLAGIDVGGDGVLSLEFSNGVSRPAYRIPLATFTDPDALSLSSGSVYRETIKSGTGLPLLAGDGGAGEIVSESLESSTVDIAEEMTDMLITQNAYSASAKVINTIDKMLEEAVRIGG
jgi:flagellar hook protein FlgE